MSHFHDPSDGYVYLEGSEWLSDGQLSASSVIHKPKGPPKQRINVSPEVSICMCSVRFTVLTLSPQTTQKLRDYSELVTTSGEVIRYIQDIVVFLRLSRAVSGGVSAKAKSQFHRLAEYVGIASFGS